ncbi:MAG TPA: hypothetical protein VGJ20_42420 [Xanthobacteraceae bacterium]|jgi:hypothetical protein
MTTKREGKAFEAFGFALDPAAATILGLHEDLIKNVRYCLMNGLLDDHSLRLIYLHIEAAKEHLYQATMLTASRAVGSMAQG